MTSYAENRAKVVAKSAADRKLFLETLHQTGNRDQALEAVGHKITWMWRNGRAHPEFDAARRALMRGQTGEETISRYDGEWDGKSFGSFRRIFLNRDSPWYHERIAKIIDYATPGSVHLVITPPYHAKTAIMEDYCGYKISREPATRILYGHSQIEQAKRSVGVVKSRFEPGMDDFAVLQREFGPFSPVKGMNSQGGPQVWAAGEFNVYKRQVGVERDFSMRALGMNSNIAGTRCDLMMIDDPQEVKTLNLTDKIMHTLRDDWFTRPGGAGITIICMNVVGDGDIAEELIRSGTCTDTGGTVTILKAFDEAYRDLGPRRHVDGRVEESPWLWPEFHDEKWYAIMRAKVGNEAWERKFQQDWRPATTRTFTQQMVEKNCNPHRSVLDPVPKHPTGRVAELGVALDPGFTRAAVSVCAFEPTILRFLDSAALLSARSLAQQIDFLADRIRIFHRPGLHEVKWVTVETKGFQKAIVEDDAFLELRNEIGFEVIAFETNWKKNDEDYGVTQMARSMERGEFDFPTSDALSKARFAGLFSEFYNWRPSRGTQLVQDELMAAYFNHHKWHKMRRSSIERPADAAAFAMRPVPISPLVPSSDWRFGVALGRR